MWQPTGRRVGTDRPGRYRPAGTDRARLQRRSVPTARPVGSATALRSRFPRLLTGAGRYRPAGVGTDPRWNQPDEAEYVL